MSHDSRRNVTRSVDRAHLITSFAAQVYASLSILTKGAIMDLGFDESRLAEYSGSELVSHIRASHISRLEDIHNITQLGFQAAYKR